MPLTVSSELRRRIRESPGSITIAVRRCEDERAAVAGLRSAAAEIAEIDGGWESAPGLAPGDRNGPTFVGAVVATPTGPVLTLDGGHTPLALLERIPETVARHLREHGVDDAVIDWPAQESPLDHASPEGLYGLGPAVLLTVFPPPSPYAASAAVTLAWVRAAAEWVASLGPGGPWAWAHGGGGFPVPRKALADMLDGSSRNAGWCLAAAGAPGWLRATSGMFVGDKWLVTGAGGPGATVADLEGAFDELATMAEGMAADVGYAAVRIEPTFRRLLAPYISGLSGQGAAAQLWPRLCDEFVGDAFAFQVLGPGHRRRLDEARLSASASIGELTGGKMAVRFGATTDWLGEGPARLAAQLLGRDALRGCLLPGDDETVALWLARSEGPRT